MHALTSLDEERIAGLRGRDEFFWLDLTAPSDAEVERLGELFGLHPLVVEDTRKFGQRPKLDDYDTWMQLVFYGARVAEDGEPEPFEVHLFVSGGWVVTVHAVPCPELDELRGRLDGRDGDSEQFVVYRILDTLTDTFFPLLTTIDEQIDALEDGIVAGPTEAHLHRIFQLKQSLVVLRRAVAPQRDLFARAIDDLARLPGLEPGARDYFRDVYDHLIRISEQLDSYRDLLTGALDVYLSTVSNRLNAVMKQLTLVATIFLPLTFVTGFFGQNFRWMVDHVDSLGAFTAFGIGGLVLPAAGLFAWFKRSGFL